MGELQAGSLISSPPDQRELEEAANAFGVETTYWDIWHREHRASVPAMTAILGSLGVDASSKASLDEGREKRERQALAISAGPHGSHHARSAAAREYRFHCRMSRRTRPRFSVFNSKMEARRAFLSN